MVRKQCLRLIVAVAGLFAVNSATALDPLPSSVEISNFATNIDFVDWATLQSFPLDAQDTVGTVEGNNPLDWKRASMANDASKFYLYFENYGRMSTSWAQTIYLDTDGNSATGWQSGLAIGADFVIQGDSIFKYTGNDAGTTWEWDSVYRFNSSFSWHEHVHEFPRSVIGNPLSLRLVFVGINEAFGGDAPEDLYPDGLYDAKGDVRFFTYNVSSQGNNAPVAVDQGVTTAQGEPVAITLQANDLEGDVLTYDVITPPVDGVIQASGQVVTYTPNDGFVGFDFIEFVANDGTNDSQGGFIDIEVTGSGAPIVMSQMVNTAAGEPIVITIDATNPFSAPLTYNVTADPQYGTLDGSGPVYTYTPGDGFEGIDEFSVVASNGVLDSEPAQVEVEVFRDEDIYIGDEDGPSPIVDGDLSDWQNINQFTADPSGDVRGSTNRIDYIQAAVTHYNGALYLGYENNLINLSEIEDWAFNTFLDTDSNHTTGFTDGMTIGSEYLLQGAAIYKYTGDGASWQWDYLGDTLRAITGKTAEVKIDLSVIGNPSSIDLAFTGDNPSIGGTTEDLYPDGIYDQKGAGFFSYDISNATSTAPTIDLQFDAAKNAPLSGRYSALQSPVQPSSQLASNERPGGGGSFGLLWLFVLSLVWLTGLTVVAQQKVRS